MPGFQLLALLLRLLVPLPIHLALLQLRLLLMRFLILLLVLRLQLRLRSLLLILPTLVVLLLARMRRCLMRSMFHPWMRTLTLPVWMLCRLVVTTRWFWRFLRDLLLTPLIAGASADAAQSHPPSPLYLLTWTPLKWRFLVTSCLRPSVEFGKTRFLGRKSDP